MFASGLPPLSAPLQGGPFADKRCPALLNCSSVFLRKKSLCQNRSKIWFAEYHLKIKHWKCQNILNIWANLMLWENYLTSVGKDVSKESQNCLLSNVNVVLRHWGNTRVCRWLFSSCQREGVGNMGAPRMQLTLRSTDLLLLLDFYVCVRQCWAQAGLPTLVQRLWWAVWQMSAATRRGRQQVLVLVHS